MKSYVKLVLMAAFVVLFLSTVVAAQMPGTHTAYLHALGDLRNARANVNVETSSYRMNVQERRAVEEIDAAMREMNMAGIDDGKMLGDHAPVDPSLDRIGRLRVALNQLVWAHKDIADHESDEFGGGLKHRALMHIDEAYKAVNLAINPAWHQ